MRALVTGAAGFAGQWLCRELLHSGWDVWGTRLDDALPPGALDTESGDAVHWWEGDLRAPTAARDALDAAMPDAIFHLAGIAHVPSANADPAGTLEVNVIVASRMLGEVRTRRAAGTLDPVVVVIGSGEQYGRHDAAELPLTEEAAQRPMGVYAASKAAQEVLALEAHRTGGVRVISVRPFNHTGPGQSPNFVIPALVRRAVALRGTTKSLVMGNTDTVRDFSHVEDVARAYVALAERGVAGEAYNIASGVGTDMASLAQRILALAGVDAKLQTDPALVRPADVPALVGSAAKLRAATAWAPRHSLDSILEELIRAASH
ncbi:MAG: NAD-dependent epimerase/dehydratase [Gemmatimonadetes bacterium]|nr:NAD-dependent epimerase/dehydratase [Gemmatimonadota bacterium]